MMRKTLLAIAAGTALMAATAVNAQGYAGAGVGPARIDVDCADATTCDKSSTGYKFYGGYQFGSGFAVEGVYFNWGKAKATGNLEFNDDVLGTVTVNDGKVEVKAYGVGAGIAYFFPVTPQWTPVVRLGIVRNKAKSSASGTAVVGELTQAFSGSVTDNYTAPYFGVGIGYKVMPNLALTGEVDFSKVKFADGEKANTRLVTVGLRYSF
jgi:OOP family OmpA-OmpF porin